jgi:OmpA-OmpF porin, OOP family
MKRRINTLLIAVTCLLATQVHAQWYAGGMIGEARGKGSIENLAEQFLDLGYTASQSQADKRDITFRVFGGYQLNRYFAIEGGYADLGKFDVRSTTVPTGTFEQTTKTTGFDVSAVAILPLRERLNLFARVGAFLSERKTDYVASGAVEILQNLSNEKQRQTKVVYGAGVSYDLSQRIALRAEWARHEGFGNALLTGSRNVDAYSVGIAYRFH